MPGTESEAPWPRALETALDEFRSNPSVKDVPAGLIERIVDELGKLPPQSIPWAGSRVAAWAGLWHQSDHLADRRGCLIPFFRPPAPPSPMEQLEACPHVAPLILFHHSGYFRQAALRHLARLPNSPFFIAALFWRTNDWVAEVRAEAIRAGSRLIEAVKADAIVGAAPYLLSRELAWERWDLAARELLHQTLARNDVAEALASHLASTATGPVARTLQLAMRTPAIDEALPTLARSAISPHVRRLAYHALGTGQARWPARPARKRTAYGWTPRYEYETRALSPSLSLDHILDRAGRDRSPIVRRGALDILIQLSQDPTPYLPLLAELRADASPSVRQRADFLIQKFRPGDGSRP